MTWLTTVSRTTASPSNPRSIDGRCSIWPSRGCCECFCLSEPVLKHDTLRNAGCQFGTRRAASQIPQAKGTLRRSAVEAIGVAAVLEVKPMRRNPMCRKHGGRIGFREVPGRRRGSRSRSRRGSRNNWGFRWSARSRSPARLVVVSPIPRRSARTSSKRTRPNVGLRRLRQRSCPMR
jgi:hypothetical protein